MQHRCSPPVSKPSGLWVGFGKHDWSKQCCRRTWRKDVPGLQGSRKNRYEMKDVKVTWPKLDFSPLCGRCRQNGYGKTQIFSTQGIAIQRKLCPFLAQNIQRVSGLRFCIFYPPNFENSFSPRFSVNNKWKQSELFLLWVLERAGTQKYTDWGCI